MGGAPVQENCKAVCEVKAVEIKKFCGATAKVYTEEWNGTM